MKRIKLVQNGDILIRGNKVTVPFQGGITALLQFSNNDYLRKLREDSTLSDMFDNFVEFEFNKKVEHEHFALSFENKHFVLIARTKDEPFVFRPCGDGRYCSMEQYGNYCDCGNCHNCIGANSWGGNHPCGQQVCEFSCTYCQYNSFCYAKEL